MSLVRATALGHAHPGSDHIALTYEARLLRRRRMVSAGGREFLLDLPETVSVNDGDAFRLEDGTEIAVRAAPEALIEIAGDLPRLAWHIGNRHTPCQVEPGRLLIRRDHVLADMLARLGATLREVCEPFTPEGGAYGHGRTFGHSHGGHGHSGSDDGAGQAHPDPHHEH